MNPVTFLLQARDELLKVTWPTRQQVIKLTLVVITISVAVSLYVGGLDYLLTQATTYLIK